MTMNNKTHLPGSVFVTAFLCLCIFCAILCTTVPLETAQAQGPPGMPKTTPAVRVETVGTLDASQPKNYVGVVTGKRTVNVVSRVSGYLDKVAFTEGAHVEKDDILFEIEDTTYKNNVRVAEAIVKQIEAEIELAKRDLERTETLHGQNVATEQEMDQARRTITLQEAKLEEAKATLDQAKTDLSYTKIHAPLTGRIGEERINAGNYITPNSGILATIVQYDPIRVKVQMAEADFMSLIQGAGEDRVKIEIVRANGEAFQGKFSIDFIDNLVDSGSGTKKTGTITVFLECENADHQLLPGGWAKVRFAERFESPMPAVSIASIMIEGSKRYVYVVESQNKVERRDITVGKQVYDKQVVLSGLKPGESVVAGGLNKVKPGDEVRPIQTAETALETAQKR